ncbi:MAG: hypothetical protein NT071_11485 [Burkholderiales bacterium]|nr:hypothetical protein [Burkholderiales bacterium]
MIPVAKVKKPKDFDSKVKTPGEQWLKDNPGAKRPKALWAPYTKTLADGFDGLCGYAAMVDPTGGTVDHYLSFKNHPSKAYDWPNYRFASGILNNSKRNADDTVLDPYESGDLTLEGLRKMAPLIAQAVEKAHADDNN